MTNEFMANVPELTVSELSASLKRTVEDQFGHVRVRGELSGVKRAGSGHIYMSMKDDQAVLDTVCWRGTANRLTFRPEDGLEVIATGKLTTYAGRSKYQLVVDSMEPAGEGALMALLEQRRKALAAEGLFDPARKQRLPFLPGVIGVVTSPTGAVIRDILHRLGDRFPRHVLVWPVKVQGEGAAEEVATAIRGFNRLPEGGPIPRPDLLIVARGGGSIEDLWAFNEEVVVRAASASDIPLISAVGHETDTTLIDHAADARAPTPTAAAEMAVPVRADLQATVADLDARMIRARRSFFDRLADRVTGLGRGLPRPRDVLGMASQRLDEQAWRLPRALQGLARDRQAGLDRLTAGLSLSRVRTVVEARRDRFDQRAQRLDPAYRGRLEKAADRLEGLGRLLGSLSHEAVLRRGFAALFDEQGKPVTRSGALKPGQQVVAQLQDGRADLLVKGGEGPARPRRRRSKDEPAPDDQGQLL